MSFSSYTDLCETIRSQIPQSAPVANACLDHLRQSLVWTAGHIGSDEYSECDIILKGCYGAAVEAVSLISFGLVRPAVLSLRSHYELTLMFLFYKDHPVEFENVKNYRSRPKLPGEVKKYLKDNYPKFEMRWSKLSNVRKRRDDDCYEVLSGIAHGTALASLSGACVPSELVEPSNIVAQSEEVFFSVGECISDIFVSCNEGNWFSLPSDVTQHMEVRFGDKRANKELMF